MSVPLVLLALAVISDRNLAESDELADRPGRSGFTGKHGSLIDGETMQILLVPPIAFLIYLVLVGLLSLFGKGLTGKARGSLDAQIKHLLER